MCSVKRFSEAITKINQILDKCVQCLLAFLFVTLILIASLNVFFRYILKSPLFWAVEASCYILVYLVFYGSALALYRGNHISINVRALRIAPSVQAVLKKGGTILEFVFIGSLIIWGTLLTWKSRMSYAGVLPISTGLVYAAAPSSGIVMLLFQTELLLKEKRGHIK